MTSPETKNSSSKAAFSGPSPLLVLCLVVIAAGYVALVGAQAARFNGNMSGLVCFGDHFVGPKDVHEGAIIYQNSIGYDGQFFYFIARDPMMEDYGPGLMVRDRAAYRYMRIFYPLMAGWFARGKAALIPATLVAMNLLGIVLGGLFIALIARRQGQGPWWSLIFALLSGLAIGALRDLAEPLAVGLTAGWLYFHLERKYLGAGILLAFALLTRETTAVLAAPIALHGLLIRRDWEAAAAYAAALIPLIIWILFIHSRLGDWPIGGGTGNLGLPLAGMIAYGQALIKAGPVRPDYWYGLLSLAVWGYTFFLALRQVVKTNTGLAWAFAFSALFFSTMTSRVWVEPWSYGRVLLPLGLLLVVSAIISRDKLYWPALAGQAVLLVLALSWQGLI